VNSFAYWVKLDAAENKDNIPLDLDYLLTVEINNPYKALYAISDWLNRTSADTNNEAKIFVGNSTFEELTKERRATDDVNVNMFSRTMLKLNSNVYTETGEFGTRQSYGVTIKAVSLVDVAPVGDNREEVLQANTAVIIAEKNAEATVVTAQGAANAAVKIAEGNAKAVRLAADAEKYAVDAVYGEIQKHGAEGIAIRQLQTMEKAGAGGNNVIWANNPLMEAARIFRPAAPTTNPTPPQAQPPQET
jgi:regulator of protease activity HflC (stomatin/prohibitin superfamily)